MVAKSNKGWVIPKLPFIIMLIDAVIGATLIFDNVGIYCLCFNSKQWYAYQNYET